MIHEATDAFLSYKVKSNVRKVFLEYVKNKFAKLKSRFNTFETNEEKK